MITINNATNTALNTANKCTCDILWCKGRAYTNMKGQPTMTTLTITELCQKYNVRIGHIPDFPQWANDAEWRRIFRELYSAILGKLASNAAPMNSLDDFSANADALDALMLQYPYDEYMNPADGIWIKDPAFVAQLQAMDLATSEPTDADAIATQATEDLLVEDAKVAEEAQETPIPDELSDMELLREIAHRSNSWDKTSVYVDMSKHNTALRYLQAMGYIARRDNGNFSMTFTGIRKLREVPVMSVQAQVIAHPTESRFSTEWEFSTAKVPDFSRPIHATPEQLQHMANLMVEIKSTEIWREAFYAKHARWYDGRLDATFKQAETMLTELETIKAEQSRNPIRPPYLHGYHHDTRLSKRAHDDLFMLTMQLRAFCKKHGLDYEFHKRDITQRASQFNHEGITINWQHLAEIESVTFTRLVEAFMSQALEVE